MSDIVARLRKRREAELIGGYERIEWEDKDAIEAADKIDDLRDEVARLTAENEKLRAALEPFASMGKAVMGRKHHNEAVISYALAPTVKIRHFVAAHLHVTALQDKSDE